jgi:sirohydrochlorin ferrochelatase
MKSSQPAPVRSKTALLLIAHGSRNQEANADLHALATELRATGHYEIVEPAFLELTQPDIDLGAEHCISAGARYLILLPYFLSAGVHVRRDLSAACERLSERYPEVVFRLAEPLGPHPLLIKIIRERVRQAESS